MRNETSIELRRSEMCCAMTITLVARRATFHSQCLSAGGRRGIGLLPGRVRLAAAVDGADARAETSGRRLSVRRPARLPGPPQPGRDRPAAGGVRGRRARGQAHRRALACGRCSRRHDPAPVPQRRRPDPGQAPRRRRRRRPLRHQGHPGVRRRQRRGLRRGRRAGAGARPAAAPRGPSIDLVLFDAEESPRGSSFSRAGDRGSDQFVKYARRAGRPGQPAARPDPGDGALRHGRRLRSSRPARGQLRPGPVRPLRGRGCDPQRVRLGRRSPARPRASSTTTRRFCGPGCRRSTSSTSTTGPGPPRAPGGTRAGTTCRTSAPGASARWAPRPSPRCPRSAFPSAPPHQPGRGRRYPLSRWRPLPKPLLFLCRSASCSRLRAATARASTVPCRRSSRRWISTGRRSTCARRSSTTSTSSRSCAKRGAIFVEQETEVPEGEVVVFSAHGVAPSVQENAKARELRTIDATCPLVTKVHVEARKFAEEGYTIILDRPRGPRGGGGDDRRGAGQHRPRPVHRRRRRARARGSRPRRLHHPDDALASTRPTGIIARLRERFPNIVGPKSDDICYATTNRQIAVKQLARRLRPGAGDRLEQLVELQPAGGGRPRARRRLAPDRQRAFRCARSGSRASRPSASPRARARRRSSSSSWSTSSASAAREDVSEVRTVDEDVRFMLPREIRSALAERSEA